MPSRKRQASGRRAWAVRGLYLALAAGAAVLSAVLCGPDPFGAGRRLPPLVLALVATKWLCFELFHLPRNAWNRVGLPDVFALAAANTCGSLLALLSLSPELAPSGLQFFLDWLLIQTLTMGAAVSPRACHEFLRVPRRRKNSKCVLIYGTGSAALAVLGELRSNPHLPYEVMGFVDDDPEKLYSSIQMTPVLGTGDDLARVTALYGIDEVLIAAAEAEESSRMVSRALAAAVPVRLIPALSALIAGAQPERLPPPERKGPARDEEPAGDWDAPAGKKS